VRSRAGEPHACYAQEGRSFCVCWRRREVPSKKRQSNMWIWGSICSAARKIDKTKLKQYTPDPNKLQHVFRCCTPDLSTEKRREIQKMMWGNWNSICFVAGKIDNTVREYAPDKRVFLTTFGKNILDVFFMNSGFPGLVGFVSKIGYKTWKESLRTSQSGVPSQLHVQCNENGERMSMNECERAELERLKMLVDAQRKPSPMNQPFSPYAVIKELEQSQMTQDCSSQMTQDCSDHVESDDK